MSGALPTEVAMSLQADFADIAVPKQGVHALWNVHGVGLAFRDGYPLIPTDE